MHDLDIRPSGKGIPIGDGPPVSMNLRLMTEERELLNDTAARLGTTAAELVRALIRSCAKLRDSDSEASDQATQQAAT